MLAEDVMIVDPASSLWLRVRPLLETALRLDQQNGESASWCGWQKQAIDRFLQRLPEHCTLMVGVWDDGSGDDGQGQEHEMLVIGFICEVRGGTIRSVRTLEALGAQPDTDLPPIEELEPGFQHAFDLMRAVRTQVAPVAWALFTDWGTWNEWVYGEDQDQPGTAVDKGAVLTELALQGRCVLMGSQVSHHHHP